MFAVTVRVPDSGSLAARMTTMRQWLDHQHIEPALFRYIKEIGDIRVLVAFRAESDAVEFAGAFDGELTAAAAA